MGETQGCGMGPQFGEVGGGAWEQLKGTQRDPNLEGGGREDMGETQGCKMGPEFGGGGGDGGIGAA